MKKSNLLKVVLCIMLSCFFIVIAACEGPKDLEQNSSDRKQAEATQKMLGEAQRQVGMPNIVNFQQRKMMKWIYELADRTDLITYTYIKNEFTGQFIFVGKSIGFGVPFSAQYTNPERIYDVDREGGALDKHLDVGEIQVIPQADPNGLFMPTASSATWVIMVHPETGKPDPQYWEPLIVVTPKPLSKRLGTYLVVLPEGMNSEDDWGKGQKTS